MDADERLDAEGMAGSRNGMRERHTTAAGTQGPRRAAVVLLFVCTVPLLVLQIMAIRGPLPASDFVTYWSSAHLFVAGGNPYAAGPVFALEKLHGWGGSQPLLMLCPPWTMPLIAPLGVLSYDRAHLAWLVVSLLLNGLSGVLLWRFFGGSWNRVWAVLLLLATFLPVCGAEKLGQVTPIMLACLTGFLVLLERRSDFAAGLMLAGMAIKPQLFALVFLAVLLWTIRQRRWGVLAGGAAGVAACTGEAIFRNRNVLTWFGHSYGAAMATSCGAGGALRKIFGMQHAWLQFLPLVCGLVWFVFYWRKHGAEWQWRERLPLLALVSVATAPYCWYHDYLLILPALVPVAIRVAASLEQEILLVELYAALQVVILLFFAKEPWMSTAGLLWLLFWWVTRPGSRESQRQRIEAGQQVVCSG